MVKRICLNFGTQVRLPECQLDVLPATLTIDDERGIERRLTSFLLAPPEQLCRSFRAWQKYISPPTAAARKIRIKSLTTAEISIGTDGNINLDLLAKNFRHDFNNWLGESGWFDRDGRANAQIREVLERNYPRHHWHRHDIQIFIETEDKVLRSFPWQEWDILANYCLNGRGTEISISATDFCRPNQRNKPQISAKVRILAVFGDERLDLERERQLIANLRKYGGDVVILDRPDPATLALTLRDPNSWHIFCFFGHSGSDDTGKIGWVEIQPGIILPIAELTDLLATAIEDKLQLAIFNSCDGLGLANSLTSLSLPYCIVMRESVDSFFARRLLEHLLTAFVDGKSIFEAMYIARSKLWVEFDLEGKQPGKSWLPVIVANPEAKPLTWDGLFTDRRLSLKWELLISAIVAIAIFGLPLSILWEFEDIATLKFYAQLYPQLIIYPSILLCISIYALYRTICLMREKSPLFWWLTVAMLMLSCIWVGFDLHADPLLLFELRPHASVSIPQQDLVEIATSHHFALERLPKFIDPIDGNGNLIVNKDKIESSIRDFIYLSPSTPTANIDRSESGFFRVALSAQVWQNGFLRTSISRWFYAFTHFSIFFCALETLPLTIATLFSPNSIFKKHRFLTYLIIAQLSALAWTPFYFYYVNKIKVLLFAPKFDPRLSSSLGLFYLVAIAMSSITFYSIWTQTSIRKYRYILMGAFALGLGAILLMTGSGVAIIDWMFGVSSGSVVITWLATVFTMAFFYLIGIYAIDRLVRED
jgi:hypothetical protein